MNHADQLFIYPTDTVWGIGCSIYSQIGYKKIAEIKKTSTNKPLSIVFSSVEEVMSSFLLPKEMTLDWLRDFFKLESTMGLPLKAAKIIIPEWATENSSFISFRCLETDAVQQIYREIQAPFFTTSLNLTGNPPIIHLEDALLFQREHAPEAIIVKSLLDSSDIAFRTVSTMASSIIFFDDNLNFTIKRAGRKSEELKRHLMQLY